MRCWLVKSVGPSLVSDELSDFVQRDSPAREESPESALQRELRECEAKAERARKRQRELQEKQAKRKREEDAEAAKKRQKQSAASDKLSD